MVQFAHFERVIFQLYEVRTHKGQIDSGCQYLYCVAMQIAKTRDCSVFSLSALIIQLRGKEIVMLPEVY